MRSTARIIMLSLGALLLLAPLAHAQSLAGESSDLTIVMTPSAPAPKTSVTLSVESSILDTANSTITWYAGGSSIGSGVGMTSASIVTGALGHETDVTVSMQTPDGITARAEIAIIPTEVDLLVDSDSYVPPFYQGRALPSAGTSLRLQAIAHLVHPGGAVVAPSDITYTWKQDGRVVGNVSGRGKSSAVLPSPTLYGTGNVEVDVRSSDNSLAGSASVVLPAIDPAVTLYEDNPLLGITYYHALSSQTVLPDTEMTFAAVPYFAQIQSPNDPRLAYAWTVNGSSVRSSSSDPSELTLNASNSNGVATVGLGLTHSTNIYMSSNGLWNITLGSAGSNGLSGTAVSAKDPFSGQGQ
jgi:hypothetical protein